MTATVAIMTANVSPFALTDCDLCPLHLTARRVVWGEGPTPCDWMFIGEAPGNKEDRKGRPFWGPSGTRITALFKVAGLCRWDMRKPGDCWLHDPRGNTCEQAFITNIVKHRPPNNRKPTKTEIGACQVHLLSELDLVQPKVIVTLGDVPAKWFDKTVRLSKDHGFPRLTDKSEAILVPMYHPAYTLYRPDLWPLVIRDFQLLRERVLAFPSTQIPPNYRLASNEEALEYVKGCAT
jgi:uracil-DNA glycosylase